MYSSLIFGRSWHGSWTRGQLFTASCVEIASDAARSRRRGMLAIQHATILIDSPLERAVEGEVLPVVQHGQSVTGHVVLRGSTACHGLSLIVTQCTVDSSVRLHTTSKP